MCFLIYLRYCTEDRYWSIVPFVTGIMLATTLVSCCYLVYSCKPCHQCILGSFKFFHQAFCVFKKMYCSWWSLTFTFGYFFFQIHYAEGEFICNVSFLIKQPLHLLRPSYIWFFFGILRLLVIHFSLWLLQNFPFSFCHFLPPSSPMEFNILPCNIFW